MGAKKNSSGYEFTLLSEDVASEDLFEDRTHERASESLYQIIRSSQNGVTIGLEGSWGSGKSTVVNLLRRKLVGQNDNTLFFMFDAWAHDGDPLRRIFLESLIREIDPEAQDSDLQSIKGRISGRTKTINIQAKKSTSRLGKYISFSALLIPFGTVLLGKVNYDLLVAPWSDLAEAPYFQFIFAFLISLAPIWVLVYWKFWGDKDPISNKRRWDFFAVESIEDYTQDISEDGERTSIEFEDYFKEIIQTAKNKSLIDKCIIVIDNLDRVDPDHAKNIWATLQTFFQKRSLAGFDPDWSQKLWFLIPFDREGFIKIWSSSNDKQSGRSFLTKCFQLIAEVPDPVMSGWAQYATNCVEEALREWPDEEKSNVLSTYIRYASRLDRSPTPRDVKLFCNQIGLLGSMWGGRVSAEALSLYVLLKDKSTTNEMREGLINREFPGPVFAEPERNSVRAELAGLLFGVNKEKGLQLLLGPVIHKAFSNGAGETLKSLEEEHGNAFWIAYEASRGDWSITQNHTDEYKVSFTKALYDGLKQHRSKISRDAIHITDLWLDSFLKLDFSNYDYSEPISFAYQMSDKSERFIKEVQRLTTSVLTRHISSVGDSKFQENSTENLIKMTRFLDSTGNPVKRLRYNNLSTNNWKKWLDHLEEYGISFEKVLPSDGTIKALSDEAQFSSPSVENTALTYLVKTYDVYPHSSEWAAVADQLVAWMKLPNRSHECESVYGFALKLCADKNEEVSGKVVNCIKTPEFWVVGRNSECGSNPSLAILTAISLKDDLQSNSHVSVNVKSFWSSDKKEEEYDDIFSQLEKLNALDTVWLLCLDEKNSVAAKLVVHSDKESLYSISSGASHIDEYGWASEEDILLLSERLAKHGSFNNNKSDMKGRAVIYQDVFNIFYALNNPEISTFIDEEVSKVDKAGWENCIKSNGSLIRLVKSKNPYFSSALNDSLVRYVSGEDMNSIEPDVFETLPALLNKSADLKKTIAPNITRAYFAAGSDVLSQTEFDTLSPFFSLGLSKLKDEIVMEKINHWIDSESVEKVHWLTEQNIKFREKPLETLISRIELYINSDESKKREIANKVNIKFQLKIVASESSDLEPNDGGNEKS